MGQHAEGVPLAAGKNHLGIDESGSGFRKPCAVAQHRSGPAAARLFFLHQRQRLTAGRHVAADKCRGERLERYALGAVDHLGRQVLVAQPRNKAGEFTA